MIGIAAVIASVIAESFIAYTIAELVASGYEGHDRAMPALSFLLIGLIAYSLPGAASFFNLKSKQALAMLVFVAYVVVYGTLRLEFAGDLKLWDESWIRSFIEDDAAGRNLAGPVLITTILVAATWARASFRANTEVDLETLPKTLATGFAAATILVIIGAPSERVGEVARGSAGFYAFGVLALALSQLAMSGTTIGDVRAGGVTGVLLAGIAGVTVGSVLVFGLVFGVVGPIIGPPLGTVVNFLFAVILTPPAWLISKIIGFLIGDATLPQISMEGFRTATDNAGAATKEKSGAERTIIFGARTLSLLLFLVVVCAPVYLFWRLRNRSQRHRFSDAATGSSGSLMEDLRSLLRGFGRGKVGRDGASVDAVGRLYRDVLDKAEAEGKQREPAQTPQEFAPVLADQFHSPVTDDITQAFVDTRYAGRPVSEEEVAELEQAWRTRKRN